MDVEVHNLAVRIYDALNKKGAGLGNASIGIIECEIEKSAQDAHPTGLTLWQKEEVRQMIQSALETETA